MMLYLGALVFITNGQDLHKNAKSCLYWTGKFYKAMVATSLKKSGMNSKVSDLLFL